MFPIKSFDLYLFYTLYFIIIDYRQSLLRRSDTTSREETEAYEKWNHLSELKEKFFKQKSKLHLGDQNNKNFHNAVEMRESHNSIRGNKERSGKILL